MKSTEGKVCVAGRIDRGKGYDALVGVLGGRFFRISSEEDDYSYTVEIYGDACLAGITTLARGDMDMVLAEFGRGRPRILRVLGGKGEDMLWFLRRVSDGYLLVGGVKEEDWDILVVKLGEGLDLEWVLRAGTEGHEYAYGAVEHRESYRVVGRSNFRGNWDGFLLEITPSGRIERSILVGSDAKDYLRFVGLFKGRLMAVGRSEARGDSDVWIFSEGASFLFDGGEFDYGRVFLPWEGGVVLMGDTHSEGQSDGMLLFLSEELDVVEGYSLGGEDVESVRFLTEGGWFAGYTYSFTLDNDLLLGKVGNLCPALVRRKTFRRYTAPVKIHGYPIRPRPYSFGELDLSMRIEEVRLRSMDPCSGVNESLDLAD